MQLDELTALILDLRNEENDTAEVEVKRALGGFPDSLMPTLSAFANTPGGGIVIFGLDERAGFAAAGVYDVAVCKATLATKARNAISPPATFDAWDIQFEGVPIVVAKIHELPAHGKPCRVVSSGKAFLRSYDGDYELSQVEEQAFIANGSTPVFDQQVVSRRREFHPPPLVEPCVTVSRHTAPVVEPLGSAPCRQWMKIPG